MTITRGSKHEFLGMEIEFDRDKGTVAIKMRSYLEEAIAESNLNISRIAVTPARKDLFFVDETSPKLTTVACDVFHSITAKLLYVALRARPELLTTVGFLTTRVTKATEQDQQKLQRLLEYIQGTLNLPLVLGADNLHTMYTWVDATYAVHNDLQSHTGGAISFGLGGLLCKSSKQKINTKSSTEAELVGASEYLPNTLWVQMFMSAQGYPLTTSYFEQDNESAIRMERNGRASARQRSKHINIRYFFITDRLKQDNITLRYCKMESMLADFLSKPLQGTFF